MNAAYRTCLGIAGAHARLQRKLDDELGTYHGLGLADFRLLSAVAEAQDERMTTDALAAPLGIQRSGVVRQLLALEKSGWIERVVDAGGRWVALRPPGRRVQREAAETASAICADALASIDAEVLASAGEVFDTIQRSRALELRR